MGNESPTQAEALTALDQAITLKERGLSAGPGRDQLADDPLAIRTLKA